VVVNPERSVKANLPEQVAFFAIDRANVIVTAIKKADDGEGMVVRLYDSEGKDSEVNLASFFNFQNLQHTNIIEENPTAADKIRISPYAIETYQVEVK
jgi:alpha-mannosidase